MSEIKYLTHREAAELRVKGEKLMYIGCGVDGAVFYDRIHLSDDKLDLPSPYYRAPRVFTHPGGTCPAPETEAPGAGAKYWVPSLGDGSLTWSLTWDGDGTDRRRLSRGLVYLTREAAIARAELMLAGVAK